jgi:hypothetical protein
LSRKIVLVYTNYLDKVTFYTYTSLHEFKRTLLHYSIAANTGHDFIKNSQQRPFYPLTQRLQMTLHTIIVPMLNQASCDYSDRSGLDYILSELTERKNALQSAVSANARHVASTRRTLEENIEDGVALAAKLASVVAAIEVLKSA